MALLDRPRMTSYYDTKMWQTDRRTDWRTYVAEAYRALWTDLGG